CFCRTVPSLTAGVAGRRRSVLPPLSVSSYRFPLPGMTSNRACISCPPVYLPPSRSKKETFTQIQKHKVLRQARFFRWLRFHHSPVAVSVFPAGSREKRDTATALGVYRSEVHTSEL